MTRLGARTFSRVHVLPRFPVCAFPPVLIDPQVMWFPLHLSGNSCHLLTGGETKQRDLTGLNMLVTGSFLTDVANGRPWDSQTPHWKLETGKLKNKHMWMSSTRLTQQVRVVQTLHIPEKSLAPDSFLRENSRLTEFPAPSEWFISPGHWVTLDNLGSRHDLWGGLAMLHQCGEAGIWVAEAGQESTPRLHGWPQQNPWTPTYLS